MRFLIRLIGFVFLVVGFVAGVADGARAIADNAVSFVGFGPALAWLFPMYYPRIEPLAIELAGPYLWDPVLVELFRAPAFVVAAVVGVLLLWLGRQPPEPIGFSTRR